MRILPLNETSILRKFFLFFLLVSIVPLVVLFFIYSQIKESTGIDLSANTITNIILLVILGIVCGYWAMRKTILEFIETAKAGQKSLSQSLAGNVPVANQEGNETDALNATFKAVTNKLEEDRKNLENAKRTLHSVLTRISVGLSSNDNINGFVHLIVETATEALDGKVGLALLLEKDTRQLMIKTIVGTKTPLKKVQFHADDSVFANVLKHKKAIIIASIDEVRESSREHLNELAFPIVCAPLLVQDQILGVLAVCGKKSPGAFKDDDCSLLYNMALQAGVAINNDQLKNLANVDPLTGIYNYRHMSAVLDYETMRLQRYPGNLSLLIFDIDGFKPYNDEFGHPEGDALLIALANAIAKKLRASDVFCRYGGDEFAVILPQTPLPGALFVANKMKEASEELNLKKKITISIGGAEWTHPMSRHDLLVKADKALYRAKQQGKDRILLI